MRQRVRIVRVERERLAGQPLALPIGAAIVVDRGQRLQRLHVVGVEGERPRGRREAAFVGARRLLGRSGGEAALVEMQPAEHRPRLGIARVARDGGLEAGLRLGPRPVEKVAPVAVREQHAVIALELGGDMRDLPREDVVAHDAVGLAERRGDLAGEIGAQRQQVERRQGALVGLAPDHLPALGVDELRREAEALRLRGDAAREEVADLLPGQRREIGGAVRRRARGEPEQAEIGEPHQVADKLVRHPVGEEAGRLGVARGLERGDRDRGAPERAPAMAEQAAGIECSEHERAGAERSRRHERPRCRATRRTGRARRGGRSAGGRCRRAVTGRHLGRCRPLPPREDRQVAALRDRDQHRIVAPRPHVVCVEIAAEPARLDAHHGVGLRVEIVRPAEDAGRDGIALQPVAASGKRLLHHIAQEVAALSGALEAGVAEDARELRADGIGGDVGRPALLLAQSIGLGHRRRLLRTLPRQITNHVGTVYSAAARTPRRNAAANASRRAGCAVAGPRGAAGAETSSMESAA